jgi:endonuclease YncB( thermonuclease family)
MLFGSTFIALTLTAVDARCPNGYHKSPSGDCEKVTHRGGLLKCPDDYHRSPDGDCEKVHEGSASISSSSNKVVQREPISKGDGAPESLNVPGTRIGLPDCKGSADCFRGSVTEIVDGDTIDVNNVRIRLSMVNTPERGEAGYNEATETTESECQVGSTALVDEDDGQKEGSYDRLIGVVYCNGNTASLNQLLLEQGKAIIYEEFCDVSEFANDKWVTNFGC